MDKKPMDLRLRAVSGRIQELRAKLGWFEARLDRAIEAELKKRKRAK